MVVLGWLAVSCERGTPVYDSIEEYEDKPAFGWELEPLPLLLSGSDLWFYIGW